MAGIGDYNKKGKGNRGFKMKGSEFFGHGSDSPAKVSDSEILKLQHDLNKSELDFKEPGWAKVAGKIHGSFTDPLGMGGGKGESEGDDTKDVAETAKTIGSLFGGGAA